MKKLKIILIIMCMLVLAAPIATISVSIPAYKAKAAAEKARKAELQIPVYNGVNATKIPVLTYHMMISSDDTKHTDQYGASLFIKQDAFDQQMKYLHDNNYRTIGTKEFYLWYKGDIKLPPKSVMITFDDGDYSVVKFGLPVLKKYHDRATIFSIGKEAMQKHTDTQETEKGNYYAAGSDVIRNIRKTYPRLEFQSHTYDMHHKIDGEPALLQSTYEEQKKDFTIMTGKFGFNVMAYPFGEYSATTIKAAKAAHVKMAFTYGDDEYATRDENIYELRRIKVNADESMDAFTKWL